MRKILLLLFLAKACRFQDDPVYRNFSQGIWNHKNCGKEQFYEFEGIPPVQGRGIYQDELGLNNVFSSIEVLTRRKRSLRRIKGGVDTPDRDFPWLAVGRITLRKDLRYVLCSCTAIAPDKVLSTQRCTGIGEGDWEFKHLGVYLGAVDIEAIVKDENKYLFEIDKVLFHGQKHFTDDYNHDSDVSLVFLKRQYSGPVFESKYWVYTTGWKNEIPKCSTLLCAWGKQSYEDTVFNQRLKCLPYITTTNLNTFNYFHLIESSGIKKYNGSQERYVLASMRYFPREIMEWASNDQFKHIHDDSSCFGNEGAPLIWRHHNKGYFLFGIHVNSSYPGCSEKKVDFSVNMLGLAQWLKDFVPVTWPLERNKIIQGRYLPYFANRTNSTVM